MEIFESSSKIDVAGLIKRGLRQQFQVDPADPAPSEIIRLLDKLQERLSGIEQQVSPSSVK
ncbi:MAG: hypothetical protein EBS82_02800 [Methylocystaceae bacterium]|jgi:hypothetical protein|nr:hypothetical protein [Methylocystaceae bacterium]NBT96824.1 hypothetical protein [Methylocystaceae bacterium]